MFLIEVCDFLDGHVDEPLNRSIVCCIAMCHRQLTLSVAAITAELQTYLIRGN